MKEQTPLPDALQVARAHSAPARHLLATALTSLSAALSPHPPAAAIDAFPQEHAAAAIRLRAALLAVVQSVLAVLQ